MRFRLPDKWTVLIAGTGKTPVTLMVNPVAVITSLLVLISLPISWMGWLLYHNTQLSQRNQELTDTANQVLTQIDTLDAEIESLKERAGLETDDQAEEARSGVSLPTSAESRLPDSIDKTQNFGLQDTANPSDPLPQGGPATAIEPEALFDLAQQKLPTLDLVLAGQVKPALEQTLASEAKRAAAFPSGQPVEGTASISSEFGLRRNPFGGKSYEMHEGIDFRGPIGSPILATANGEVVKAQSGNGYGRHVRIDHGYGYETLYAHLSALNVEVGDPVKRGDVIGFLGNTGRSSGPHLHYGIYRQGQAVNPRYYLKLEDREL